MSASLREIGNQIFPRMEELRDQTIESIKQKAREIDKSIGFWGLGRLKSEGVKEFFASVDKEFPAGEEHELADLMKSGFKTQILGSKKLNQEIIVILGSRYID